MSCCRITDLRDKEVICVKDGTILGCVCDVEVDTCTGELTAIVVFGRAKAFGLLGREEDTVIPWCNIQVIGEDAILIEYEPPRRHRRKRKLGAIVGSLFGNDSK